MGKDLKGKYRARITLFHMLNYAYQNDVIMKNPCNGMVNSDIGRSTQKKEALTWNSRKGTPVKNSTYDTVLFKRCDKIGLPRFSMHVLRHAFAA